MTTKRVTVIGATGIAGGAYVAALKAAGYEVRGTVRPGGDRLALIEAGASPVEIDLRDAQSAASAIDGSDAIMIALMGRGEDPAADEAASTRAVLRAVTDTKVRQVVYTSVHLADADTGVAHFDIKRHLESELHEIDTSSTVLRPTTFMDALDAPWLRDAALEHGVVVTPFGIDTPISYLAADDLARLAVLALEDDRLRNATVPVGGPRAVTYRQLMPLLEQVSGRPLRYEQMDLAALAAHQPHLAAMVRLFNADGFTVAPSPLITALGVRLTDVASFLRSSAWAAATSGHDQPSRARDR